ncbi:MAG: nucleoside hydrolase [Planctomycetota bacterium]
MKNIFTILPLLLMLACSTVQDHVEPVLYCTDLFHPHDDPDDHFDVVALYALQELDIRGIVLDQGARQDERPGRIPVEQLNFLTGRDVPCEKGLSEKLKRPDDEARDQAEIHQAGVRLILDVLEATSQKVTLICVGSLRDVAAAFNRDPDFFRARVSKLMIFIGEASAATREWNVGLDPNAFICIMNSGLPVWWVPCFDGGNFKNKGNASFWKANHADLLRSASDRVMNFFIYALLKIDSMDHLEYLERPVDAQARKQALVGTRNLWCAAVFTAAAGRRIVERDGERIAVPASSLKEGDAVLEVFRFVPVSLFVNDDSRVVYGESSRSHEIFRFQIVNRELYAETMTSVTRRLIHDLDGF